MIWIGIDVGGTFTDVFAFHDGSGWAAGTKVSTDPRRPIEGIETALTEILAGMPAGNEIRFIHGTTLATNALLESSGGRVGLVTTEGFRDVLEIGRMKRLDHFNPFVQKTPPLVPRELRFDVSERITGAGQVLEPLSEASLRHAADCLSAAQVDVVAICFINSFANPDHEIKAKELLSDWLPGVPVSISSEVSPEYGEFERTAATVLNAYLLPRISTYMRDLSGTLSRLGIDTQPEIVASNGGLLSTDVAAELPLRLVMSGPAAGVSGAAVLAAGDEAQLVTLDIGGTSTDVAVITEGRPRYASEREVAGWPIRTVTTDVHSIGSGGGSIAWLDAAGSMRIGPQSAGSDPGPACYGRGGLEPTVTDADLLLGYLDATSVSVDGHALDLDASELAIRTRIAEPRGVTSAEAAVGMVELAITNVVGAVRTVTTERGLDPRDFSLVAFGGAGPTHAAAVAARLGMPRVIIPQRPSILSAVGMVASIPRVDEWVTFARPATPTSVPELNRAYRTLEARARRRLQAEAKDDSAIEIVRVAELCFAGQRLAVPVPVPAGRMGSSTVQRIAEEFLAAFRRRFGFVSDGEPQFVNLRVMVSAPRAVPELPSTVEVHGPVSDTERSIWVIDRGARDVVPVLTRADLTRRSVALGPCIVKDDHAEAVIGQGQRVSIDHRGNLVVELPYG